MLTYLNSKSFANILYSKQTISHDLDEVFLLIRNLDMLITNYSSSLELLISNRTYVKNIGKFHHPILYGIAIYALFLTVIGTIGKSILHFQI